MGEGEGGTNWESSMETLTLPYVKETASGNLLYEAGSSTPCSVTTWGWAGWGGEVGGGREVQVGGHICTPMADSC